MKRLVSVIAALALAACATSSSYAPSGKIEVLSLGHSALRITTATGKVIVVDPFLTGNSRTPAQYKDLKNLGKVDAILVTHGHPDHVSDAAALAKLNNARVFAPSALGRTLIEVGALPQELVPNMNKGGTVTPLGPEIKITMVRAEHSSEYMHRNPATGRDEVKFGGEPVGFIIELENGFRIYNTGDTTAFGDMKLLAEMYKPHLVLIPIGGHFTADIANAAYAVRELIRPEFAIPVHYGTFPAIAVDPQNFVKAVGSASKVIVLQPGESAKF
jgi:L-ascorbate metabolism protein UlaG (beta-lactamase superfamily)